MLTKGLCLLRPCFTGVGVWSPSGPTCASICLTVTDPSELPDPPDGCEFAEWRSIDLTSFAVGLFQWDGAAWQGLVAVQGVFNAGQIDDVDYATTGTWTATLNGVEVSGAGTHTFTPAVNSLDVVFIDGACSYAMEPAVSTPIPLLTLLFNDTTLLPFDPSVASNWNGAAGDTTQLTDVIVTGTTQVELFGFTGNSGVLSDGAGIYAFSSNILFITDHASFITEILELTFSSSSILGLSFPALQIVGQSAFVGCFSFGGCGSAVLTDIGIAAFSGTNMSEGTHLLCTSVGSTAFSGTPIANLVFPILQTIESSTFDQMPSLVSADFASCLTIGASAFADSPLLATVNFPVATFIGNRAFDCSVIGVLSALTSATFPEVITIDTVAFRKTGLTTISLPKCTTWELNPDNNLSWIFRDCENLVEVIAPLLTNMGGSAADNQCFLNITGNTIAITVPTALATNNGGNPDGDIDYLDSNNTLTVTYV